MTQQVYLFISATEPRVRAFTFDKKGGNLPPDHAPWRALKGGTLMRVGPEDDPVTAAIVRDGFFVVGGHNNRPGAETASAGSAASLMG